ncbi:MAG: D-alanyl-D-alanine carboxypeptidase/D-alanyl-D-alanine-endopeptidase [Chitinophagaceae bacterium]|nr:D-alanyl-D-alanine carboxypeptidase/D-alanyl-D-alanine-endopeptidase [Chitinophagaceae bacterium]
MDTKKIPALICLFVCIIFFISCSVQQQIGKKATADFINNANLINAHIGISIYEPASNQFLYNYQSEKYFVPASNTKIFSCYAGLKNLGDSLPGIRYTEDDTAIYLFPTGDPSLLHKDFRHHPVIDFLQRTKKSIYITDQFWKSQALGSGWAWNDYNESYMVERSPLPMYGNLIRWIQERTADENKDSMAFDQSLSIYSLPEVNWKVRFNTDLSRKSFFVQRGKNENTYEITEGSEKKKEVEIPFVTNGLQAAVELFKDTIYKDVMITSLPALNNHSINKNSARTISSQPTDTILKLMMHRSDNFFAEQVLLMASNEKLGIMDDDSMINYLLKNDLNDLPQKPRWVDGSGLSRYNLFTPRNFVAILNKMKQEFPLERIKTIFPTVGEGTLTSYPRTDSGYIFAKTGTLSGVVALSGFLYTRKNRLLIFSILVNNHRTTATQIRKNIQAFLYFVRNKY